MSDANFEKIKAYFIDKLDQYGATPRGLDWNSVEAQEARFAQVTRVIDPKQPFSILDYGCGFGSLYGYLQRQGLDFQYTGFDVLPAMIDKAGELLAGDPGVVLTTREEDLAPVDYVVECGVFNLKLEETFDAWQRYVVENVHKMDRLSRKGFAFTLLTSYSDPEYMKSNLYYADPTFYFDYCKRHFSRNVALLHDYNVYDFTILVRKSMP